MVRDDDNPDYVVVVRECLTVYENFQNFKKYVRTNDDRIFIFFSLECIDPDLNIFDYASTWNPDLTCGDRIIHNICRRISYDFSQDTLSREEARKLLDSSPRFCNFMYSHASEPIDTFFHLLSQYKHVDSSGMYLHNIDTPPTRLNADWYSLSIEAKKGYKFSIAMENAAYKGYTTEKIVSSFCAHTVPIYWGDPCVTRLINPKAFINCNDYASPDDVVERVKESDSNDDLWLDMITQPWQTEEQHTLALQMTDEPNKFMRHIFEQDLKSARRRPVGFWNDNIREGYCGLPVPLFPRRTLWRKAARKCKHLAGMCLPQPLKRTLKEILHMS